MKRDSSEPSRPTGCPTLPVELIDETEPPELYAGMAVCRTCGRLKGTAPAVRSRRTPPLIVDQSCRCRRAAAEKWPGYDFNLAVELCRCCGQVLLSSGSRWSVWFCSGCKALVEQLNGRLRRYALPIGRHSMHGGFMLNGQSTSLDILIFAAAWSHIAEAIHRVEAWSGLVVRRVLDQRWPDRQADLPLLDYLARCDATDNERRRRFEDMLGFLNDGPPQPEGAP